MSRKSTQEISDTRTQRLRVRTEKYMMGENAKGRPMYVVVPWHPSVMLDKQKIEAGEEFDCPLPLARALLQSGTCQRADDKPTPFRSPSLEHREMRMTAGVLRAEDTFGKIPVYDVEKDNKGEWENDDF